MYLEPVYRIQTVKKSKPTVFPLAYDTSPVFLQIRQTLETLRTRMTSSSKRQHSSKIRKVLAVRLTSRESNWKDGSRNCYFVPVACQTSGCKPGPWWQLYSPEIKWGSMVHNTN